MKKTPEERIFSPFHESATATPAPPKNSPATTAAVSDFLNFPMSCP
ncbi:hypothetical protein GCM10017562_39320 [Streptomyces roseofulvus]